MDAPPVREHHRPHISLWLVAEVGLAAGLIALGSWVLVDRYTGGGGATHDATTLIDDSIAAATPTTAKAATALLTSDVEVWMPSGVKIEGAKGYARYALGPGLHLERTAPVTVDGDFATTFVTFTLPTMKAGQEGRAVAVFQLKGGKIFRVWYFQLGVTEPFDNAVTP